MTSLAGVFPVLPTPFTPDGRPDTVALLRLLDFAIECGCDGIVFPGMASEVETLQPVERAELIAAVGGRIARRLPFIVGASDADPQRATAHASLGAAQGAVAAMIMAPARLGAEVAAQSEYYSAVAAACPIPIMLQNAPPPNGAGLAPDRIAAIVKAVPAIRFVKEETMPCGQHITAIRQACAGRLDAVFGGAGARYVMDELIRGAAGTMPALELADVHTRLYAAFRAGDLTEARRLYTASLPLLLVQAIFRIRATKDVLRHRGLLASADARAAGPVPDAQDLAEIRTMLEEADAAGLFATHRPDFAPSDLAPSDLGL